MSNLNRVVYLTEAQKAILFTNQTITVNGITINYSDNDLYITPDDGRVNGHTILSDVPANAVFTDYKVTQNAVTTANTNYPIILAYDGGTGAVTNVVNKTSTLKYNPSTHALTVTEGKIAITHKANSSNEISITYGSTIDYWWGVGTANVNHGLYDNKASKWILSAGADNIWSLVGNVTGNATTADSAKYLMNRGTNVTIGDSSWAHGQKGRGGTNTTNGVVWKQKWAQSGLTYTPSGGSATTLTDSGDIVYWLSQDSAANNLWVNMAIDGYIYSHSGFKVLTQTAAFNEGIRFVNSSAVDKGSINTDTNGVLGIYAASKISLRPILNTSTDGVEINTSAMWPTKTATMTLGTSSLRWTDIYADTLWGTAKHASSAHFGTTDGTSSGMIIKVKIKKKVGWMLAFTMRLYQAYTYQDIVISGYNYGSSNWYSYNAYMLGSSSTDTVTVTFGYDNDAVNGYKTLWVSIPRKQYIGIDIFNVTNGYTQIDLYDAFEIIQETTSTGTVQGTKQCVRPWLRDETVANATYATSAGSANSVAWANVSDKPATSIAWGAGTTAGPTLTVTAAGSSSSAVAIPSASKTASGIVTTGAQAFKGRKTFGYMNRDAYDDSGNAVQWAGDTYYRNAAGTVVAETWYNCGNATNITTGQFSWRQYSPNSTANTSTTGKYETYSLPAVTAGLTENKTYAILTSKNTYHASTAAVSVGWNTETTIATINGTAIKIKIPANPNTNTDTLVKQTVKADDVNYKLLATTSASPSSGTAMEATYSAYVYANASTGAVSAQRHTWNLSGTEKAYTVWNDTNQSVELLFV